MTHGIEDVSKRTDKMFIICRIWGRPLFVLLLLLLSCCSSLVLLSCGVMGEWRREAAGGNRKKFGS
jgi:hypothetical protein